MPLLKEIKHNNIITITRGDSAMTTLAINIGTDANPFYYSLCSLVIVID